MPSIRPTTFSNSEDLLRKTFAVPNSEKETLLHTAKHSGRLAFFFPFPYHFYVLHEGYRWRFSWDDAYCVISLQQRLLIKYRFQLLCSCF